MTEHIDHITPRLEASFLFTPEERESLILLCGVPGFSECIADSLDAVLRAEEQAMQELAEKLPRESALLAREIENAEAEAERRFLNIESVFA